MNTEPLRSLLKPPTRSSGIKEPANERPHQPSETLHGFGGSPYCSFIRRGLKVPIRGIGCPRSFGRGRPGLVPGSPHMRRGGPSRFAANTDAVAIETMWV